MPEPKGNLVTPIGVDAADKLHSLLCDAAGRLQVVIAQNPAGTPVFLRASSGGILYTIDPTIKLDRGLVGWWKFIATEGTTPQDHSGWGNHGAAWSGTTAAAAYINGVVGQALSFDGVDDYVDMGDDPSFSGLSAITVEAWFNTNNPTLAQRIVSKIGAAHEFSLLLADLELKIQLFTDVGNVNVPASLSSPLANTWHHAVMTYDSANVRLYLDSIKAPNSPWPLTGVINNTTIPLRIGHNVGTTGQHFHGLIDEVRIYNRALSAEEILLRYELTRPENLT